MHIIDKILRREEFRKHPPVLVDIGAAGVIHQKWRSIASYSVCIAFDADSREMGYVVKESSGFRKLYVYNCIVTAEEGREKSFYLTDFPQCSSLLRPQALLLQPWVFAPYFDVQQTVTLKTVTLPQILKELQINKIDWFKTDSQGTDLRLFKSLGAEMIQRVLAAEFEPGIIDAYEGEDKLWSLIAFMEDKPFWMSDIEIKGVQRFNLARHFGVLSDIEEKILRYTGKISPCWGEVTYLNTIVPDADYLDKRDYLLGWVFAIIEKQYGFALELAQTGYRKFDDPLFLELKGYAISRIRKRTILALFFKIRNAIKYFSARFGLGI